MSEAQHDNLQNADGQDPIEQQVEVQIETPIEEQEEALTSNQSVLEEIDNSNAEENEDDSVKEKHEIEMLDYDALSMEELTDELEKLVTNEKVMAIKDHAEGIRKAFSDKYIPRSTGIEILPRKRFPAYLSSAGRSKSSGHYSFQ